MGCCESFAKIILIILNIIFFVLGTAILGVGIWLKVDKSNLFEIMRQIKLDDTAASFQNSSTSALNILAILLIVIGAFTFITGFCGCCGAINESKCLLYTYAFLVSVVVIVEISVGIYAGVQKSKFQDKIKEQLTNVLINNFNGLSGGNASAFTFVFSALMIEGKCCGVNNNTDFERTKLTWKYNNNNGQPQLNPIACCPFKAGFKFEDSKATPKYLLESLVNSECPYSSDPNSIKIGCVDSLINTIGKNLAVVIGVCVGIGLFEILCIIFACCLARKE